jgi:hypothetical protein
MTQTRRREIPFKGRRPASWTIVEFVPSSGLPPYTTVGSAGAMPDDGPVGMQETASENHPGWARRKTREAVGDIGGNFYTSKRSAECSNVRASLNGTEFVGGFLERTVNYSGYFLPLPTMPAWPPDASSSDGALSAYGTKAVAECKPTNALVDLASTLAELVKDGAPNKIGAELWKSTAARARQALGHEYLNYEFGWKPLIGDVRNTALAIMQADAAMRQYQRDAGKLVRRRFDFPSIETEDVAVVADRTNAVTGMSASAIMTTPSLQGRVLRVRKTYVRRWFSGAFTYHLPYLGAGGQTFQKASHIYGLDLKPETLWNLAPWSWAVDWFVPVGDLIGNLQDWASDGLVLRYGYIMEHSLVRDTYTFDGPTGFVGSARPSTYSLTFEVKKRRRANPFGFGLTWSGLSPRQLAIAAALGISRD